MTTTSFTKGWGVIKKRFYQTCWLNVCH